MTDRELFVDYRVHVIALGLIASWAGLGVFAVAAARGDKLDDPTVLYPLIGLGAALVGLTLLPWRRILAGRLADGLVLMWAGLAVFAILMADGFSNGDAAVAAFLGTVVFAAAALVAPTVLALVGAAALAGYVVALARTPQDLDGLSLGVRIGAFAVTTVLLLVAARGIRRQMSATASRLLELTSREAELARRERELERLYEISRTIGYGSKLADVLPELVGQVTGAIHANTGLVLLYRPGDEALEVISPIWVNGHTVRVEDYSVPIASAGVAQRVFTSGTPELENELHAGAADGFLAELDASRVAAVPLQIEGRTIGVLIAADKAQGEFTDADLGLLASLAGPSALVLNQMSRYEAATETGERMTELARLKTDFVSVVSHELRTPLTSIIGSLKTLQRPELAPTDPNAVELLMTAERQGQRLRSLIEDLLMVSRLDNQALPVRPRSVELEAMISEIVTDVPGARPVVTATVDAGAETMWVDADHLARILRNLLENALKYAPGSAVEIHAQRRGTEIWISVADHGAGIPYELHDHIFDRFTQVQGHETRGIGGTGLGLSIVRGLTEAMGGRVWFEPTQGGGATFSISLPARAGLRSPRADLHVPPQA